jgi:hypothetical protein
MFHSVGRTIAIVLVSFFSVFFFDLKESHALLNCKNLPAGLSASVLATDSMPANGRCARGAVVYNLLDSNGNEVQNCIHLNCDQGAKLCKDVEPGKFPTYKCVSRSPAKLAKDGIIPRLIIPVFRP